MFDVLEKTAQSAEMSADQTINGFYCETIDDIFELKICIVVLNPISENDHRFYSQSVVYNILCNII